MERDKMMKLKMINYYLTKIIETLHSKDKQISKDKQTKPVRLKVLKYYLFAIIKQHKDELNIAFSADQIINHIYGDFTIDTLSEIVMIWQSDDDGRQKVWD